MADEGEERQFLGNIVKNKTKYGSTTKPLPKFKSYIKHKVLKGDTLMGIALKYGGSVEVIKRENKLWTNDSLFLREHIFVPVTPENSHMIQDDWEVVKGDDVRSRAGSDLSNSSSGSHDMHKSHDLSRSHDQKVCKQRSDSLQTSSTESDNKNGEQSQNSEQSQNTGTDSLPNGMDFFNKYDSNIAQLKDNLAKLEQSSRLLHNSDDPLTILPRRHSDTSRSMYAGTSRTSPRVQRSVEIPDSPVLVIRSNTRSKSVATTLQRSEQLHDSLYEL